MNSAQNPLAIVIVFDCVYAIVLGVLVWYTWRPVFRRNATEKFNYSIVEIWAGIIGITPSYLVLKHLPQWAWVIPTLLLTQITMMLFMKMDADTRKPRSQLLSVASILLGSVLAFLAMPILSGTILGVFAVGALVTTCGIIAAPVWIPILVVFGGIAALRKMDRK